MNKANKIPRFQFITGSNARLSHADEARQACEGGVRFIQFREKNATLESCKRMAETTLHVCRKYNAWLIIDDYIEVAKDIQADGVHLGYNDEPPIKARQVLGDNAIIGGTGNNIDHVRQLANEQVDYVGVGPYQFTYSKNSLKPTLGIEGYRNLIYQMQQHGINVPVFAIGGIQMTDIPEIFKTGVYGIAVSSAIGASDRPLDVAQQFIYYLQQHVS